MLYSHLKDFVEIFLEVTPFHFLNHILGYSEVRRRFRVVGTLEFPAVVHKTGWRLEFMSTI